MEKVNFTKDFYAIGNDFRIEYEQLFETYNESQCAMVLIKKKCQQHPKEINIWKHISTPFSQRLLMRLLKLVFSSCTTNYQLFDLH